MTLKFIPPLIIKITNARVHIKVEILNENHVKVPSN